MRFYKPEVNKLIRFFLVEEWTVLVPGDIDLNLKPTEDVRTVRRFCEIVGNFSENVIFKKLQ